jgi:photosystem II stability/assembly factor-like uncharacterized protein
MSNIIRFIFLCFLAFLTGLSSIEAQWTLGHSFFPNQTIGDIYISDNNIIYAVSALYNNTALNVKKSEDNGTSWNEQYTGYTRMSFRGIDSPNGIDVFALGNEGVLICNNGGDTWSPVSIPTTEHLRSIFFLNEQIGYIGADRGVILKTTDGGKSWKDLGANIQGVSSVSEIVFLNEFQGYVCGFNYMQYTEDGGLTWDYVPGFEATGELFQLQEMQFLNKQVGYVCGDVGLMYKTTDGGQTWNLQETGVLESLQDMIFLDENMGFACGFEGTIIYTEDGGENWTSMTAPLNEHFRAIDFSDNRGLITTQQGNILFLDDFTTDTKEFNNDDLDIQIHPMPCSDILYVEFSEFSGEIDARIFSLTGVRVGDYKLENAKEQLDLRFLSTGTYIIDFIRDDQVLGRHQLIIQE